MLSDCISVFQKHAGLNTDKMIIDNYILPEGFYLIMEESSEDFIEKEHYEVKFNKKTKQINIPEAKQLEIGEMDYFCKLIDTNKPIDNKKIIQSNNYLSFWIKKESLINGKLTSDIIENYYEILSDPLKKYSKKKDKELYQFVSEKVGEVNQEKLLKIRNWIKNNIFQLPYEMTGKDYLKIFFLCDGTSMKNESERYIIPNLFNKNDYNIKLDKKTYGLPNENMGLNSKKPYLENKNRKYVVPILSSIEDTLLRKSFFDYLWGRASKGYYNIYFDLNQNKVIPLEPKESPDKSFKGYYLRIKKDKNEAAILDMDYINAYEPNLKKPFIFKNILDIETKYLEGHRYGRNYKLSDIRDIVNEEIFSKYLLNNLFNEPMDVSCGNDEVIRKNILEGRNIFVNWFYKGYDHCIVEPFEKLSLSLIKNSISNGNMGKVQHQFNAYISILNYLKGDDDNMADVMKEIRNNVREKINQKEYANFQTDEEYFYAIGQLIRYFLSLNKSNKKMHSLFNPFLSIKSTKLLNEKLEGLFIKYNYNIGAGNLRFNNIYNMVVSYAPLSVIKHDYMIAGYISKNLIYEKKED